MQSSHFVSCPIYVAQISRDVNRRGTTLPFAQDVPPPSYPKDVRSGLCKPLVAWEGCPPRTAPPVAWDVRPGKAGTIYQAMAP